MLAVLRHPYVLLTAVALFWGGNAIAGKLANGHVSPMLLTLMRWIIAAAVMAPFAARDLKRDWPVIRANLGALFLLGAIGFAAFNGTFYLALTYTSAINVTIEQSAMPLVVFAANYVLFRTRVTALQIAGFGLTLAGVVITASHGSPTALVALDLNRGDALMMLAVAIYAGYTVALQVKPNIHWRSTIVCLSIAAATVSIVFAGAEYALGATDWPDAQGWGVVLYAGLFPGLVAQSLYLAGVSMIGPNRANLFMNCVPIFGAILAVTILGETLFAYHIAALACVLAGITLAERSALRSIEKTTPAP